MYVSTSQFVLLQPLFMFNLDSDENREEKNASIFNVKTCLLFCAFCTPQHLKYNCRLRLFLIELSHHCLDATSIHALIWVFSWAKLRKYKTSQPPHLPIFLWDQTLPPNTLAENLF